MATESNRIASTREYYRLFDTGQPFLHLFDDAPEIWFPKWGTATSANLMELLTDLGGHFASIQHAKDNFRFYETADAVIVEGETFGTLKSGGVWTDKHPTQGKFCSVFTFTGDKIKTMKIYLDPDYADEAGHLYAWFERKAQAA